MLYDEQKEVWKTINFAEYGDQYLVSNKGRVFNTLTGHYLKECDNGNGYKRVSLKTVNGKYKSEYIHRLVCFAFIPNPDHLPQVNHKNEVKADNNVLNLEWMSAKDNTNYGTCIERRALAKSKKVVQLSLDDEYIAEFRSLVIAEQETGTNRGNISRVCNGFQQKANGYHWKWADEYYESED